MFEESYKYLEIYEADTIKPTEMKIEVKKKEVCQRLQGNYLQSNSVEGS